MKRLWLAAFMSSLLMACGSDGGAAGEGVADTSEGALSVSATASGIKGDYRLGPSALQFESREVEPGVLDVVVTVNGMTLTAIVDRNTHAAEVDGFADEGGDTQMIEDDRAVLRAFVGALEEQVDIEGSQAASVLRRVASNWSQTPDTVPLQREVVGSSEHSWTSICGSYNTYLSATHDCNNYSSWAANSTSYAHVGQRTASTYYLVNNVWTTTTQNHKAYLYERGSCYGNCGGGCPGGIQTLTLDCLDHDQCVRNGHALASLYCDDEFTSASDDEFFAPDCPGT